MINKFEYHEAILNTWKTNNRTIVFHIEHIPQEIWNEKISNVPRKTIGTLASHIHNTRCI